PARGLGRSEGVTLPHCHLVGTNRQGGHFLGIFSAAHRRCNLRLNHASMPRFLSRGAVRFCPSASRGNREFWKRFPKIGAESTVRPPANYSAAWRTVNMASWPSWWESFLQKLAEFLPEAAECY
ncbi:MAG TPA: hypothetical protein VGZ25_06865, partial [Gemmataceae bacterium]|nr:hypothetical protein [Gemmataceae bacterium]